MKTTNFIKSLTMVCVLGIATVSCRNHHIDSEDEVQSFGATENTMEAIANNSQVNNDQSQRNFVKEAASDGMMEIKMAEIAMSKSNNQQVKDLAQTIKSDHQSANEKLKQIASDNGWDFPTEMMDQNQDNVDKLQKTPSDDFDRQYADMMVKGHKGAISKFENAAKKYGTEAENNQGQSDINSATANASTKGQFGQSDSVPNNNRSATTQGNNTNNRSNTTAVAGNAQLEAWINSTLPTLRKHLRMSQQVQDELKK